MACVGGMEGVRRESMLRDYSEVVVVGGGLAGLVTSLTLATHDPSLSITLLEAGERLGGRAGRGEAWGAGPLTRGLLEPYLSQASAETSTKVRAQRRKLPIH